MRLRIRSHSGGLIRHCLDGALVFIILLVPVIAETVFSSPASGDSAPQIQGLHVVTDVATCTHFFQTDQAGQTIAQAQLAASCQQSFARALVLFAFTCSACETHDTWVGRFVVNGQPSPESDIHLSANLDAAWTVRSGQFGPSDCVGITLTDIDASGHPSVASNPICQLSGSADAASTSQASTQPVSTPVPGPAATGPAAPLGLAFTASVGVCAQHAGHEVGACAGGLFSHSTVYLIWGAGCDQCSDGYGIFLVASDGSQQRIATVPVDVSVVSLNKNDSIGHCYTVRAFKGDVYSTTPPPVCFKL